MKTLIHDQVGTELAFSYGGSVVTSVVVDQSLHPDHIGLIGDFDKASATKLASQLTS
jgi:hypothetical protein